MKNSLFLIVLFYGLKVNAQNYLITFAGTGASTAVTTVKVENLMKNTALFLNGSDILRLTAVTGVNSIKDNKSYELKIYPNPMIDNSTLQVSPPVTGNAVITVYDMTGRPIAQIQSNLENVTQDYRISGLKNGFYFVNVKGNNYQFSGILISNGKTNGTVRIEKVSSIIHEVNDNAIFKENKGAQTTVDMAYTTGDRLKFTGISGNYSTVKTYIPTSDKTISFNFVPCTDADNNNYPVVEIGTQVWMAENLRTTKYNGGTAIPLVTDNVVWSALNTPGYCWQNNDAASYKATYGALYNWYALDVAINGGKYVCPTSWHLPTDDEWTTLINSLINSGYGYGGSGSDIAKSLASTWGWFPDITPGTIGNEQMSNNSSGFTGLPGHHRGYNGTYYSIGLGGIWWSDNESNAAFVLYYSLFCNNSNVGRNYGEKRSGYSIRCLRNN
jgi:uncharacterized protein (TIGR02145 family)